MVAGRDEGWRAPTRGMPPFGSSAGHHRRAPDLHHRSTPVIVMCAGSLAVSALVFHAVAAQNPLATQRWSSSVSIFMLPGACGRHRVVAHRCDAESVRARSRRGRERRDAGGCDVDTQPSAAFGKVRLPASERVADPASMAPVPALCARVSHRSASHHRVSCRRTAMRSPSVECSRIKRVTTACVTRCRPHRCRGTLSVGGAGGK